MKTIAQQWHEIESSMGFDHITAATYNVFRDLFYLGYKLGLRRREGFSNSVLGDAEAFHGMFQEATDEVDCYFKQVNERE